MQKRKQARDVAGNSIRTYKKPDSYQLPDFRGYNQEMIVLTYNQLEYTTFLVKRQMFFLAKIPKQKKNIYQEGKKG